MNPFLKYLFAYILLISACNSPGSDPAPQTTTPGSAATQDPQNPEIEVHPDFEVQLLYKVPRNNQGTWISLTVDPEGNLIASDQSNKGFYRIKVTEGSEHPAVEVNEVVMPLSGAHGLTWVYDYLYANVPGKGVFRMKNTHGDNEFDVMEFLGGPEKLAEHGNHGILPDPNENGLFVINGNYTPIPELNSSRLSEWQEDLLLPREWDVNGNARGIFAPGGYVAKMNPNGSHWEMFSIGYRNIYDAAVSPSGELFTFDSDMEWDLGMPWYRPTRLIHVVSGSDYGWRSGSGKWKEYYEDSLPPMLNTGRGSPTGMLFGTGAKFPAKFQDALFVLDWIYGTIYAFHLSPEGASYSAEPELFLTGSPLPLTDGVIGKDGAFYFITGGRANETLLYRVIYTGDASTAPRRPQELTEPQKTRKRLEAFHGKRNPSALDVAWPYLGSEDPYLRNAARVAVEFQNADEWASRALSESDTQARITGIVALAHTNSSGYKDEAVSSLLEIDFTTLETGQKLSYLRAMALIFMRLGDPDYQQKQQIIATFEKELPSDDHRINTEIVRLLVYLQDTGVTGKALELMKNVTEPEHPDWIGLVDQQDGTIEAMLKNPPPTRKLEFAFILRNLRNGWSIEQKREYFSFINEAAKSSGGSSYFAFLRRMREDALSHATEEEYTALADLTGISLVQAPAFDVTPVKGPGRNWTINEALGVIADNRTSRNFENGRNAYFATGCASCHRFNGYGGNIGPDLSTIGSRSSIPVLLEDIIFPNALISDQYSSSVVTLSDGRTIRGLVVEEANSVRIYPRSADLPPVEVSKSEIVSVEPADVSVMPPGLINALNEDELRDLIAFLKSGGNPENKVYYK